METNQPINQQIKIEFQQQFIYHQANKSESNNQHSHKKSSKQHFKQQRIIKNSRVFTSIRSEKKMSNKSKLGFPAMPPLSCKSDQPTAKAEICSYMYFFCLNLNA
jgi:hypothetical protein